MWEYTIVVGKREEIEVSLNQLAQVGWEVVTMAVSSLAGYPDMLYFTLRRPVAAANVPPR